MTTDLQAAQKTAEDIAKQAGQILLDYLKKPIQESIKSSPIDIVTEADKASERLIVSALSEHFQEHYIIGEEGGSSRITIEDADYRWYVDPLDGTVNYANRLPFFNVSIALTDRTMRPLVGVVYDPVADELFSAVRGEGATMNGQPIHVSPDTNLQTCLLASGFPYDKATNPNNNLAEWAAFLMRVRGLRRLGAAALDICYVAAGRLDGYWEGQLHSWDILAAALIVTEAGGRFTDYRGSSEPSIYESGYVMASNGHIHEQMIEILHEVEIRREKSIE